MMKSSRIKRNINLSDEDEENPECLEWGTVWGTVSIKELSLMAQNKWPFRKINLDLCEMTHLPLG